MMKQRFLKPIDSTYKTLTVSQKRNIFKTLQYKNQTDYITKSGIPKNKLDTVVERYNEVVTVVNNEIKKIKEVKKVNDRVKRAFNAYKKSIDSKIDAGADFKQKFKNDERFLHMLEKILKSNVKYLITWDDRYYALSKKKIELMMNEYAEHGSFFISRELNTTYNFSDEELLYRVASKTVSFNKVEKWGTSKSHGGFFDMHHTTPFNLERYQIYTETCAKQLNECDSCFIHCLSLSGVDAVDLQQLRSCMMTRDLPKHMITTLCCSIGIQCRVKPFTFNEEGKKQNITTYGEPSERYPDVVMIGLINNHYFLIETIPCTMYALQHCFDPSFTSIDSWQEKVFKGGRYVKRKERYIDSFTLIQYMWENKSKYLKNITLDEQIYMTSHYSKFNEITTLDYDDSLVRLTVNPVEESTEPSSFKLSVEPSPVEPTDYKSYFKNQKLKPYVKEFVDFETTTDSKYHKPYLCRIADDDQVFVNNHLDKKQYDKMIGYQLLKYLTVKNGYKNLRLYAHNAGYDIKFLFDFIQWNKIINRGHSLLRAYGHFYYAKGKFIIVEIQDSKAFLQCPLKDFGDMFNLTIKKEVMPYRMYCDKNMCSSDIWEHGMKRSHVKRYCKKESVDYVEFMENCRAWNCIKDNGMIDIIRYSSIYCSHDCQVLKQGWETFRTWIDEITGLDVDNYISISSLRSIIGYSGGTTYGNTLTGAQAVSQSLLSNIVPVGSQVNSIIIRTSICDNPVVNPTDILDSFPITSSFGNNINYSPNFLKFIKCKQGRYSNLNVSFFDQNLSPLAIRDPNLLITLMIKEE